MTENSALRSEIQKPHTNSNFLVDLGYGDPNSFDSGFSEIIFPEFRIDVTHPATVHSEQALDGPDNGRSQFLILRRGATGNLDLIRLVEQSAQGQGSKGAHRQGDASCR